ncbi:VanZ family protein [Arenibacter sp. 6A1]|uniref:VanZ family protein n=1 Tax=Arenibacter sp. 6A1 TaxID=2720391 RepID=UPI001445C197|nr:VanZ family protein [Arenibacter sp. 6A1]NKI26957.1 VanZ family protein [Arenibacter sp. 6A1]
MPFYTSLREKHLWIGTFSVVMAIYATLFVGRPLANVLRDQDIQALIFLLGMVLVGTAMVLHAIKTGPSKTELSLWVGIVAVYVMLFLRLGIPERSHLIEYSVLAILIHKALIERKNNGKHIPVPSLASFLIAFLIGVLDECLQLFLPHRVFDPVDIVFNGLAVAMAIGSSVIVSWAHKKIKKP